MPRRPVRISPQQMTTAHDFSFAKLDEPGEIKLEEFAGKAILVVNVASTAAHFPSVGLGPYCVTKYGTVALAEVLREFPVEVLERFGG